MTPVIRILLAVIVFIGILFHQRAHGKSTLIDSLYSVLEEEIHDTLRTQVYLKLAETVYVRDMYEAESLTQRALALTDKNLRRATGKELQSFRESRGSALNNMGFFHEAHGRLTKALKSYHYCLNLCEEIGDERGVAVALNNIGHVYYNQVQYEKALEYYNRALTMEKELAKSVNPNIARSGKRALARVLNNIGLTYKTRNELKKALEYYQESLRLRREIEDKPGIANSLNNMGMIYQADGQNGKALEYYLKCIKLQKEIGSISSLANTLNNIGEIYRGIGKFDQAIKYSERSLELSSSGGDPQIIRRASRTLSILYGRKNDFEKAYKYLVLNSQMKDSVLNEETHAQITEIQQKYESEKNLQMIAMQDAEIESRNKMNRILTGVLILVFIFAIILYTRFRVIKKQKLTIENQQGVLLRANKEIREQSEIIEIKNKDITDSIRYAQRIQQAMLPSKEYCKYHLKEHFVLFKPKDIVSGDFYWVYASPDSKVTWMVADCTGHGVPGAFMSMIGNSLLNEIVVEKRVTKPGEILDMLKAGVINALGGGQSKTKDGMDGVVCTWDKKKNTLDFAGAYNSLYLYRKGVHTKASSTDDSMRYFGDDLVEFKTDRQPISMFEGEEMPFNTHEIQLKEGDCIYTCSDGWQDQFGGPRNKKFGPKRVLKFIDSMQNTDISSQGARINMSIQDWQGIEEQIDDICVIGVQV